jgi:LysM repeat protein
LTPLPSLTRAPSGATFDYTVQEGDWLYGIANKFGVDPQQIIDLNNLTPPYSLAIGQVLKIPGQGASTPVPQVSTPARTQVASGTKYTVQEGEWVYSIARKFGVDPYAIIEANNLQSPYTLYPGQVLVIP